MEKETFKRETMYHLLSLKVVSSSFNVIPINLNGSCNIKKNLPDGDIATNDSLLDVYAKHAMYSEFIPNINFITFVTKCKLVKNKLAAQLDNIIPSQKFFQ